MVPSTAFCETLCFGSFSGRKNSRFEIHHNLDDKPIDFGRRQNDYR
jgi:hypothetical protein